MPRTIQIGSGAGQPATPPRIQRSPNGATAKKGCGCGRK